MRSVSSLIGKLSIRMDSIEQKFIGSLAQRPNAHLGRVHDIRLAVESLRANKLHSRTLVARVRGALSFRPNFKECPKRFSEKWLLSHTSFAHTTPRRPLMLLCRIRAA